jgi:diacylglycerol O-acyltransferase / wax synthase
VPGPQFPLYLGGRRMLESLPYIPLFAQVRVAVAIFSYDGALSFGVSGDYDTTPDIDVLCEGIERGVSQLVTLAVPATETATAAARAARPTTPTKPTSTDSP